LANAKPEAFNAKGAEIAERGQRGLREDALANRRPVGGDSHLRRISAFGLDSAISALLSRRVLQFREDFLSADHAAIFVS
jgi:hypothetical protein